MAEDEQVLEKGRRDLGDVRVEPEDPVMVSLKGRHEKHGARLAEKRPAMRCETNVSSRTRRRSTPDDLRERRTCGSAGPT